MMVHPKGKKVTEAESDSDTGHQKYMPPFRRPVMPPSAGETSARPGAERQHLGAAVDSMLSRLSTLRQSSSHNKPAELFRKDLISAMKLPDSEILNPDDYYEISDCWRQDWEKGVQVPVNPDTLHTALACQLENRGPQTPLYDYRMPKKYLHSLEDETYRHGQHELTGMQQLAEQVVRYDLDDQDVAWLNRINQDRQMMGDLTIQEWTMERVLEALETECHERLSETIRNSEGLGIEYDEDVICDVCRSPDSEETNEMVFCDQCDICLHQACYGIQMIPEGSWLCRTCALGIQPACILCPNKGGAMKSTKSGTKWCHVSCALWIPEVSIGCVEKMEPITKISQVPSSRWELICVICRERTGACIQCCVKSCKTSFHVTCAFNDNLDMKTILTDEQQEEVKLKAYCPKHSKKTKDGEVSLPCSPRKQYTEEEKKNLRQKRIQQIEEEFYTCVDVSEICGKLSVCDDVVRDVYEYWKLKRRANLNRPLLMARREEADLLSKQQEDSLIARMKMFVHLRQDLERVRNLCYMVSRREKTRRSLYNMKEQIFKKQLEVVLSELVVSSRELARIVSMNHGSDLYDKPEYILKLSGRFDEEDEPMERKEVVPVTKARTPTKRALMNGLVDGASERKRKRLAEARLISDTECAMATLSDNERLPASDRVSTSPESDSSASSSGAHVRLDRTVANQWMKEERVVEETGKKLTVAGQTVRVKGLKRVTKLPSLRSRETKPSPPTRPALSECNVVIDKCLSPSRTVTSDSPRRKEKRALERSSRKPERTLREPERTLREPERTLREPERTLREPERTLREPERTLREPERTLREPDMRPLRSERSCASKNLMASFDRVDSGTKSRSSVQVNEHIIDERRVEPLRVNLGRTREIETESTSSDTSTRSSSSSTINGYRRHSDVNGRHRRRTKRRHSSPAKRNSPVKCTLISPVKLKLTLTDQVKHEPLRKSDLCQSFVSDRTTSPYKTESNKSLDNHCSTSEKKLSKSNSKSSLKNDVSKSAEKRTLRTQTVSVADMLKLRRNRTLNLSSQDGDSDSGESSLKRARRTVDSDSDSREKLHHRRSHHS